VNGDESAIGFSLAGLLMLEMCQKEGLMSFPKPGSTSQIE